MAGVLALLGRAGDLGRARGPRALVPVALRMPAVALDHAIANLSIKSWFPGGSYEGERVITVLLAVCGDRHGGDGPDGWYRWRFTTEARRTRKPPWPLRLVSCRVGTVSEG